MQYFTIEFKGAHGLLYDKNGKVYHVDNGGQGDLKKVLLGWKIKSINEIEFSHSFLVSISKTNESYNLVFEEPKKITLQELQGKWWNDKSHLIIVEGLTCNFIGRMNIKLEETDTHFRIENWYLNKFSNSITWIERRSTINNSAETKWYRTLDIIRFDLLPKEVQEVEMEVEELYNMIETKKQNILDHFFAGGIPTLFNPDYLEKEEKEYNNMLQRVDDLTLPKRNEFEKILNDAVLESDVNKTRECLVEFLYEKEEFLEALDDAFFAQEDPKILEIIWSYSEGTTRLNLEIYAQHKQIADCDSSLLTLSLNFEIYKLIFQCKGLDMKIKSVFILLYAIIESNPRGSSLSNFNDTEICEILRSILSSSSLKRANARGLFDEFCISSEEVYPMNPELFPKLLQIFLSTPFIDIEERHFSKICISTNLNTVKEVLNICGKEKCRPFFDEAFRKSLKTFLDRESLPFEKRYDVEEKRREIIRFLLSLCESNLSQDRCAKLLRVASNYELEWFAKDVEHYLEKKTTKTCDVKIAGVFAAAQSHALYE